uniref:Uncharacterized protein n=1 Tax=Cacopsylla melanoneura TaxID=428564 RepID=A0A8D8LQ27_9HEMI
MLVPITWVFGCRIFEWYLAGAPLTRGPVDTVQLVHATPPTSTIIMVCTLCAATQWLGLPPTRQGQLGEYGVGGNQGVRLPAPHLDSLQSLVESNPRPRAFQLDVLFLQLQNTK